MICLLSGYLLTCEQVCQWCQQRGIRDYDAPTLTIRVNLWLTEHGISPRLFPIKYDGSTQYLVHVGTKFHRTATTDNFPLARESSRARAVRHLMGFDVVDFITIPDVYVH
jgi:hypothetical protein